MVKRVYKYATGDENPKGCGNKYKASNGKYYYCMEIGFLCDKCIKKAREL